ncbi:leucine-rich repeat-containing protein 42 isoform X1 [Anabas testudineus]|uniref:leucine-rich repeat-containing protein 42 isoform X1 n=1 Tax=Anabas testudineus TaxID=64144 RepID=UPI000E455F10|nr:leucine-rich repeat-containing protein 42 isoform X1 [Anabas testudineus]
MDNDTIYVQERGKLRRVSDIVLAQPKPVSSCRRTNPFVLRKEHFVFTYNAEGSLRYTTKSLFDIAVMFVADNIQHVDSLVGFPEQIGDRLFAAVEENRVFLNLDISPKALQLFSDAYGHMVLGSLCLRNRFPLLHERINEIKTFHSLTSLDLFGCRLGDDHGIFQHLTSSSLASSLIRLFIGGNSLSDVGLQRLTAPIRMMKKGMDNLQILDLSFNPISERALGYLKCLPKLEKLDVSGTSLKHGTGLKTTMWNLLGLSYSEKPLDTFDHSRCKTEGWAEQVIIQWETNSAQMPKQKKLEESRTSALRFCEFVLHHSHMVIICFKFDGTLSKLAFKVFCTIVGRQKFFREVLNAAPLVCGNEEEAERERLHFYRPSANKPVPEEPVPYMTNHQAKPSWHNTKKRQRQSKSCDSSHPSPPTKRLSSSALSAEDIDLLNSY